MRRWALIAAAALALVSRPNLAATAPEDGLKAELSADKLVLEAGGSALLTMEISWPGEAELVFEAPVIPAPDGFRIERSGQGSATFRREEETLQVRRFYFSLGADKAARGEIGPATIVFRRTGEEKEERLSTQPLSFQALSSGLRRFPTTKLAVIAAVLVLAAAGIILIGSARGRGRRGAIPPPVRSPEEEAREGLSRVRRVQTKGEVESGREDLKEIVLKYLRQKYSLEIEAGTGRRETEQRAAEKLPEELLPPLRSFLSELEAGRFGAGRNENLSRLLRDSEKLISNPKEAR